MVTLWFFGTEVAFPLLYSTFHCAGFGADERFAAPGCDAPRSSEIPESLCNPPFLPPFLPSFLDP
eukprot:16991-Rhodomonas_salina.2